MLNRVTIIGRVGKDPEIRRTQSGDAVANFSVATTKKWKDKGGQQQEHTEWHRVSFFGRIAEVVEKYVSKGSLLYVEGELHTRKWQSADGKDNYTTEIKGSELKLLDRKSESSGVSNPPLNTGAGVAGTAPALTDIDDDIPF